MGDGPLPPRHPSSVMGLMRLTCACEGFGLRGLRSAPFLRAHRRRLLRRGGSPSSARHPPLHCTPTTAFSVDSDGRFHARRARFGSQPPTHSLYSHPMAHRGFVLFIAGPVRGKQRSTIAAKAPPDSFKITTLPTRTRRPDLRLRSHERASKHAAPRRR